MSVWPFLRRTELVMRANPARIISAMFLPGQELLAEGDSRATPVLTRILALPEGVVEAELAGVYERFASRHLGLNEQFERRFRLVAHRVAARDSITAARRELIGAYFTKELAIEAAALLNPSMVPHPDQSGLAAGEIRFVMSVRAVGEGHISSVEFRTGVVRGAGFGQAEVSIDDPGPLCVLGYLVPTVYSKTAFIAHYGTRRADGGGGEFVLSLLPDYFDRAELTQALNVLRSQSLTRGPVGRIVERFEWMAASNYSLQFPAGSEIGQRVLFPVGPAESHGLEDVRLVRYSDRTGATEYRGTYTAFGGNRVAPQLLRTSDFRTFHLTQLAGKAAQNKGMALFGRPVGGRNYALSRWDRETNKLATSADFVKWDDAGTLTSPAATWELVQIGNCGSPIETPAGWLVLTHGVGPMRRYSMGAILLDLANPRKVRAVLPGPLLEAEGDEREGYVPNVVYSCGAMAHGDTLVLPYGCSDSAIRFATVDLPGLLGAMRRPKAALPT
ncbi:MAG: glycoside hydrolase family 130 protein [Candidatus Nanopelagicales bacterium]